MKYSSWNKLTGWILRFIQRFIQRTKKKADAPSNHLVASELQAAEIHLLKTMQSQSYNEEIQMLKKEQPIPKSSELKHLSPVLDEVGLIRAQGRLESLSASQQQKRPIVIKGSHTVKKLIISAEHSRFLHAGATQVMASLSLKYHVVGDFRCIRSEIRRCTTCCLHNAPELNV